MNKLLTCFNFLPEDMGLIGLPKHMTDFKIECKADSNDPVVKVTCTYFLEKDCLEKATKRYRLVEITEGDADVNN